MARSSSSSNNIEDHSSSKSPRKTASSKRNRKSGQKPRNEKGNSAPSVDMEKTIRVKKKRNRKGRKRHTAMTARERRALDDPIVGGDAAGSESEDYSDDSTQPGAVAVEGGGSARRQVNSRSSPEVREEADTNVAVEATVVEDGGVTREARERIAAETRRQLIEEAGEAQVVVTVKNTTTIQKDPHESVPQYVLRHKKIACVICALLVLLIIIVVAVVSIIGGETSPTTTTTTTITNPSKTEPPTTSPTSNSLDWCPSGTTTMSFSDNYTTQSKDDSTSSIISGLENINKIIRVEVFRAQYFWYDFSSDPVVSKIRVTYRLKDGREIAVTRGEHTEQQPQGTLDIPEGGYLTKVNVKTSPNFNVIDSLEFCLSDDSCHGPWGGPRGDQEEVLHKENSVIKAFFGEVPNCEGCWVETLGCHYETCVDI